MTGEKMRIEPCKHGPLAVERREGAKLLTHDAACTHDPRVHLARLP